MNMRPNLTRLVVVVFVLLLLGAAVSLAQSSGKDRQKNEPLAVVAGQPIYDDDLRPFAEGELFQLRLKEYEVKNKALDNLVNQKLLEAEAKKKGIPTGSLHRPKGAARKAFRRNQGTAPAAAETGKTPAGAPGLLQTSSGAGRGIHLPAKTKSRGLL